MLDMSLEPIHVDAAPLVTEVMASVHVAGDWQGAVVLLCSQAFAQQATEAMFAAEPAPRPRATWTMPSASWPT